MATYNDTQFATLVANNPTRHYATISRFVYDFTNFIDQLEIFLAAPNTQPGDVTHRLYVPIYATFINLSSSYVNGICDVLTELQTISPLTDISFGLPNVPLYPAIGGDRLGSYIPSTQNTESTIRTFLLANPNTFLVPDFPSGNYLDITCLKNLTLDTSYPTLAGLTNIMFYDEVKIHTTGSDPIDLAMTAIRAAVMSTDAGAFVNSLIDLPAFDQVSYATLLSSNPSRFYAKHGQFVYDFTDMYAAVVPSIPTPPGQDVFFHNLSPGVAAAILAEGIIRTTGEIDIINVLAEIASSLKSWGIIRVGVYNPIIVQTNIDVLSYLSSNPTHYIARVRDMIYDITPRVIVADYVGTYPSVMSVGGGGVTPETNTEIYRRFLSLDSDLYTDFGGIMNDIELSFNSGDPRIVEFAKSRKWMQLGSVRPGLFRRAGEDVSISGDGKLYALIESSMSGVLTTYRIVTLRYNGIDWAQIGNPISTTASSSSNLAQRISLGSNSANDAALMVVGDPSDLSGAGSAQVYQYQGGGTNDWVLYGNKLIYPIAPPPSLGFGHVVEMSFSEDVVAVGAKGNNQIVVFEYDSNSNIWNQVGSNLGSIVSPTIPSGAGSPTRFGIAFSKDSTRLAVGFPNVGGTGVVRYYERASASFNILGTDIPAPAGAVDFGTDLSLNDDATRLIVSSPGPSPGTQIAIYDWIAAAWSLQQLVPHTAGSASGTRLEISADGSRYAAFKNNRIFYPLIGLPVNGVGHIEVREYDGISWVVMGEPIYNSMPVPVDISAVLSLDAGGDRIVIGAPNPGGPNDNSRVMFLLNRLQAFDNTYDVIRTQNVTGNYIVDAGLGTDNDPLSSGSITLIEINGSPYTSLPLTSEPGFNRELVLPEGTVYLNTDGSFRFDSNGTGLTNPSFTYGVTNLISATSTANVIFNLITELLVLDPISTASRTRNTGGINNLDVDLTGTLSSSGGVLPHAYEILGGIVSAGFSMISNTSATVSVNINTGAYIITPNPGVENIIGTYNTSFTIQVTDAATVVQSQTMIFNYLVNPALVLPTPITGTVFKFQNDATTVNNNLSGVIGVSGGTSPFMYSIIGGSFSGTVYTMMGIMGTLTLNKTTGAYSYAIGMVSNTVGVINDTFTIEAMDGTGDTVSDILSITFTVDPPLTLNPVTNGEIATQIDNPSTGELNLTGTLVANSGESPYIFTVQGGTTSGSESILAATYGSLTVSTTTGIYSYTIDTLPNDEGMVFDNFIFQVEDDGGRIANTPYEVKYTVTEGIAVMDPPNGSVEKAVLCPLTITSNLSGTIMISGAASPVDFVIRDGTDTSSTSTKVGSDGTLVVTRATGAYVYTPNTILDVVDMYSETFAIDITDFANTVATAFYTVNYKVHSQLFAEPLNPSAGSVTHEINIIGYNSKGLMGQVIPVGGIRIFCFDILGGSTSMGNLRLLAGTHGTLKIDKDSGEYMYMIDNIPSIEGIYEDLFVMEISDGNGKKHEIPYRVNITVSDTPKELIEESTDVNSRTKMQYWNHIIHIDICRGPMMMPSDNHIILAIGETDFTTDPYYDTCAIMRQLLEKAVETSSVATRGEDVITNIKNDTKDLLECSPDEEPGSLQYTFRFGVGNAIRYAELIDVLNQAHNNFLYNQYPLETGKILLVFYFDGSNYAAIANQIALLNNINVDSIVLVLTGITQDPTLNLIYLEQLQLAEQSMIDAIINVTTSEIMDKLIKSSVRYDWDSKTYLNVCPILKYKINSNTCTVVDALGKATDGSFGPVMPEDRNLRIVVTKIDPVENNATGDVIYGNTTLFPPKSYVTSKSISINSDTNRLVQLKSLSIPGNPKEDIDSQIVIEGNGVLELKAGDVLYDSSYIFQQPNTVDILVSVLPGVLITPVTGTNIFLQIGDSKKLPNNPVFAGTITAILRCYDSNTLQEISPANTIMYGSDYLIRVQLPTTIGDIATCAAAPLELYRNYPRLGLVTLYFGMMRDTTQGITPYGLGAVVNMTRL